MLVYALVSHSFDVAAVVLGGLLIAGALLSEIVNRSFVARTFRVAVAARWNVRSPSSVVRQ